MSGGIDKAEAKGGQAVLGSGRTRCGGNVGGGSIGGTERGGEGDGTDRALKDGMGQRRRQINLVVG